MALIILLVVTIVLLMLVLNWIWMVLNNRDMQRRGDVLALVAISELLDEDLLEDKSGNQVDDETAATVMPTPSSTRSIPRCWPWTGSCCRTP